MMNTNNSPHWNESDLINQLYGVEPAVGLHMEHLSDCPECAQVWATLLTRRGVVLSAPAQVSDEQLRTQRQAIWARIEQPQRAMLWRAMPVAATALLLFVGVALHQAPVPRMEPVEVASAQTVSDTQLFTELASVVNQDSPRAADSIQGLFAGDATTEAQ
ncbi:MAG TPA: hypothetical protein VGK29_20000 [Paludibaculum sp.]|jgi:hypothetical protein